LITQDIVVRRPVFLVVSGPPASGKSTLAPALAENLRMPLAVQATVLLGRGIKPRHILTDHNTTAPAAHSEKAQDGLQMLSCRFDLTVVGE
jgi:adenylylsulfate kinase-like enzyme